MAGEATEMTSKTAVASAAVTFVSGHLFFTRTLELPEGMPVADVESFAELTLEEMSPFSLEQLAWGYVLDDACRWLCIMAVCRPRVPAGELAEWDSALYVLPSFFPLLFRRPEGDSGQLAVLEANCLSVAHYEEGCPLPVRFTHTPLAKSEEETVEAPTLAPQDFPAGGYLCVEATHEATDGDLIFDLAKVASHEAEPVVQPELRIEKIDTLWTADVRTLDFKRQERKARKLAGGLWKGMLGAAIFVLVLVAAWIGLIVLQQMQASREARIAKQTPEVQALELKDQNLNDLKQFAGSPFQPFKILEELNQVRLDKFKNGGIEYESVRLNKDNEILVSGYAGNIGEVNRYADALIASGRFEAMSPPEYQTSSNRTSFKLRLRYLPAQDQTTTTTAQAEAQGEEAT